MAVTSKPFATQLMNHYTGNAQYTPGTIYLALAIGSQVTLDGSLTNEVTGGGYTRMPIVYGPATDGESDVLNTVDFLVATTDWGNVSHFALCSGTSGNNVQFYGAFDTAKDVLSGMSAQVRAGEGTLILV